MRKHSRLILASLTATLLMALAVSATASARAFSVSNRNFRIVWTSLEFTDASGFDSLKCRVTLEGSFHEQTIAKGLKDVIGHVSRARLAGERCTGGSATLHQESLPWEVTYSGFTGTLPGILTIWVLMSGAKFQIKTPLVGPCTAITEERSQARGNIILNGAREAETFRPDRETRIPLTGLGCPGSGQLTSAAGDGNITLLGNTTRIRITLI
jgi:hypothetical protein